MGQRRGRKFKQFKRFRIKVNPLAIWTGAFLIVALVLFSSLGYVIYRSDIFKVRMKNIQSNVELSQKVKTMLEGKSQFSLKVKPIVDYMLDENPEYKNIVISKRFPSGLTVKVTKRLPYAQIKGKKFYPIDKEGIILADGFSEPLDNLMAIEIGRDLSFFNKGYKIPQRDIAYVFELMASLSESKFFDLSKVSLVNTVQPEGLYFMLDLGDIVPENKHLTVGAGLPRPYYTPKKIKIIIGKNDYSRKLALLEDVIKIKFKDKLNLVQYIDLRYSEIYVGFNR